MLICSILTVFLFCLLSVLTLIPVYLSKSINNLDKDFELLKNVELIEPSENIRFVQTENPESAQIFVTTTFPTVPQNIPEFFFATTPQSMSVNPVQEVIPEFHVIQQRPIEELPNPNFPSPVLKSKLSSSNQNDNFFKLTKNNRLNLKKNMNEAF